MYHQIPDRIITVLLLGLTEKAGMIDRYCTKRTVSSGEIRRRPINKEEPENRAFGCVFSVGIKSAAPASEHINPKIHRRPVHIVLILNCGFIAEADRSQSDLKRTRKNRHTVTIVIRKKIIPEMTSLLPTSATEPIANIKT